VWDAAKELKRVLVAGQEVLHGLGDGELHIQHTAVAQDHHKEAQPALRMPHRDRTKHAPIDLGTLARGKGQGEKGGLSPGSDGADIGFDEGIAPGKALLPQALKDLGRRIRIAVQQAANLLFKGIEFAGARAGLPGSKVLLREPVGDGAGIKGEFPRDL
jgi:hypothetical protein